MTTRRTRNVWMALVTGMIAMTATGCQSVFDDLLNVDVPDRVLGSTLDDPARAALLVDGVHGTFDCALAAHIVAFGLIGDELMDNQGEVSFKRYDQRAMDPAGGIAGIYGTGDCAAAALGSWGPYRPINSARWFADDVARKLDGWTDAQVPNRLLLRTSMAAYSGYSHILLGEGYCSSAIDAGPELTPQQVFGLAESKFTAAIQMAQQVGGTADSLRNMALVGRARARLDLKRLADALQDAQLVPTGFIKRRSAGTLSTPEFRQNTVHNFTTRLRRTNIDTTFQNVRWLGAPDPRVPVVNTGDPSGLTPCCGIRFWDQRKYLAVDSPIPIARWEEARLIMAEASGGHAAVDIINTLHARVGLAPFTPASPSEIMPQVLEERRRELFLEGHRIYDVIRHQIPLVPAAGTPYPGGGVYGTNTCLPLPAAERNANPNIPDL